MCHMLVSENDECDPFSKLIQASNVCNHQISEIPVSSNNNMQYE